MKKMLITLLDIKDIGRFEFISQGHTVNQAYYVEILKRLREDLGGKRCELWTNDWILHHANATANKAHSVKQFLAQKSIIEMEHALCSHDLAPNEFCFKKSLL
jgi:hypothetical protein